VLDYVLLACKHRVFMRQADSFGLPRMLPRLWRDCLDPFEPLAQAAFREHDGNADADPASGTNGFAKKEGHSSHGQPIEKGLPGRCPF